MVIKEIEEQYPKKEWTFIKCPGLDRVRTIQVSCDVMMSTVLFFDSYQDHKRKTRYEDNNFTKHYVPAGNCGCATGAPGSRWRKQKIQMLTEGFGFSKERANKIYREIEEACEEMGEHIESEAIYISIWDHVWKVRDDIELDVDLLYEILDALFNEIGIVYTGRTGFGLRLLFYNLGEPKKIDFKHYKPVKGSWSDP